MQSFNKSSLVKCHKKTLLFVIGTFNQANATE